MRKTHCRIVIVSMVIGTAALCGADAPQGETADPAAVTHGRPASTVLAALDTDARSNAVLTLEALDGSDPAWPYSTTAEVEALWNRGDHERAIRALRQLESAGASFAPAIGWKEPIESRLKFFYQDVRIGDPRTSANDIKLGYHGEEDTLFSAVSWSDTWTMNISTDGGATWQETFEFGTASKLSMAVAGEYAWVSYAISDTPSDVRMRRFDASTGLVDNLYGWELVADVSPADVDELALINNAPDYDTAVYVAVIDTADHLRTYWDDLGGTSFDEYSPPVTNAEDNLDFTYCPYGFSSSGYVAYLSFESDTGQLEVWRMSWLGTWDHVYTLAMDGFNHYTAISAFEETVMVAFEGDFTNGNGIQYRVSYDHGGQWYSLVIYQPAAGGPLAYGADVSLHSGRSAVITYNMEEGTTDNAYFISRSPMVGGTWGTALDYSNFDTMSAMKTEITFIGAGCVGSYGMAYLGDGGIPYFDLLTPRGFFCDGFESGNTAAWD